jgi:hypothetical protein
MKKKGGDRFIVEGCEETGMGNSQERGEKAILTREKKKKIEGKRSCIIKYQVVLLLEATQTIKL